MDKCNPPISNPSSLPQTGEGLVEIIKLVDQSTHLARKTPTGYRLQDGKFLSSSTFSLLYMEKAEWEEEQVRSVNRTKRVQAQERKAQREKEYMKEFFEKHGYYLKEGLLQYEDKVSEYVIEMTDSCFHNGTWVAPKPGQTQSQFREDIE